MSPEALTSFAGILISLGFSYIPGLDVWFANLTSTQKRLLMLALLLMSAAIVYALSCTSWGIAWGIAVACDKVGLQQLVYSFFWAVIANQSTYLVSPETPRVRDAKALR